MTDTQPTAQPQTWTITAEITVTDPLAADDAHRVLMDALETADRVMREDALDPGVVIERKTVEVRRDSDPGAWTKTIAQEVVDEMDARREQKRREAGQKAVGLFAAIAKAARDVAPEAETRPAAKPVPDVPVPSDIAEDLRAADLNHPLNCLCFRCAKPAEAALAADASEREV